MLTRFTFSTVLTPAAVQYPIDRLTIFNFMWAMATTLHLASFPLLDSQYWGTWWLTLLAAIIVLVRPHSIYWMTAMVFFSICKTISWLPYPPNHLLLELYLNLAILAALLYGFYQKAYKLNSAIQREFVFEAFAPAARIGLLLLYFFAVFHKLNWDFLNLENSCGSYLLKALTYRLPFIPNNAITRSLTIGGTLLFESAIPILFLFRRTWVWAIAVGLAFHFLLSLIPYKGVYSFSAELFALFFLFTPPNFSRDISSTMEKNRRFLLAQSPKIIWPSLLGISCVISFLSVYGFSKGGLYLFGFIWWCTWGMFIISLFIMILRQKQSFEKSRLGCVPSARWIWIIPILIFLNGLSPYLGLKTETSFSMFSNLRTEAQVSNHLFMTSKFDAVGLQNDLIEIVETNLEELKKYNEYETQLLTVFEFRRALSQADGDFHVRYLRNNQPGYLEVKNGISNDVSLTEPIHPVLAKLVFFRPVYKEKCLCQH